MLPLAKTLRLAYFGAMLAGALPLVGCAGPTGDEAAETANSAFTTAERVEAAPSADDVIREYDALFAASFGRARAAHPELTLLTKDLLREFAAGEPNVGTALRTYFRETGRSHIATDDVLVEFGAFAAAKIRKAAGADGKLQDSLAETPNGLSSFFSQARDGLERTMLRDILQSSEGLSMARMLDEWSRAENAAHLELTFSAYRLRGEADLDGVRRALGFEELDPSSSGAAAVDDFRGPLVDAGASSPRELLTMWKSPSVKAQYLFEWGEDGLGEEVLAIVDEHGQLFAFTIHHEA